MAFALIMRADGHDPAEVIAPVNDGLYAANFCRRRLDVPGDRLV